MGQKKNKSGRLPLPVKLFVFALAFPPELSVELAGLRLSAYRIVILIFLIPSLIRLGKKHNGHRLLAKPLPVDWLILAHAVWALLALIANEGFGQGVESGGIYLLEATGSYLLARAYIRDANDFQNLSKLMLRLVAVLLVFAVAESVTGIHAIRDIFRAVLGGSTLPYIEPRLGLHRAFTSFDHPILYGIFCASAFGMAFYLPFFKGKTLKLRHLSRDCHKLLTKAGQLMVDSEDDPDYAIAVDYNVRTGIFGGGH